MTSYFLKKKEPMFSLRCVNINPVISYFVLFWQVLTTFTVCLEGQYTVKKKQHKKTHTFFHCLHLCSLASSAKSILFIFNKSTACFMKRNIKLLMLWTNSQDRGSTDHYSVIPFWGWILLLKHRSTCIYKG